PWEDIDKRYPVGSKHKGTVRNLTNFGVFVELEPGIDGLIHISDLSWTEKVNHPNEVIDKDEEIEVVIMANDFEDRSITLGHKQIETNPWEEFDEEYSGSNKAEGEVVNVTDKGVFVSLPHNLEGFIPGSKTEAGGDPHEHFEEGDSVEAYVIELDESNKNITLSQRDEDVQKAKSSGRRSKRSRAKPTKAKPPTGTPARGEMSGLADLKEQMAAKEKAEAVKDVQQAAEEAEEDESDDEQE